MAIFSKRSIGRLNSCHPDLIILFEEVVIGFDCTIIQGHRGEKEQNEAFNKGNSKLKYPKGNHNSIPSTAIDVSPFPIDWKDRERFHYFAGYVMGVAYRLHQEKAIHNRIRFGGDWDRDNNLKNNKFDDLVHFELYPAKGKRGVVSNEDYRATYKGRR